MARVVVRACVNCGALTVTQQAHHRYPRLRDHYRRYGGRGLCKRCYERAYHSGDLVDFERSTMSRDELLDEWDLLRSEGYSIPHAASRLGMTVSALSQALKRARADGDPRARFDWHGVQRAIREESA